VKKTKLQFKSNHQKAEYLERIAITVGRLEWGVYWIKGRTRAVAIASIGRGVGRFVMGIEEKEKQKNNTLTKKLHINKILNVKEKFRRQFYLRQSGNHREGGLGKDLKYE